MQEDTTITLIKQSIQNFEETTDVEHLNDIIQIIFEYKKASNGTCWLDNNIFRLLYHNGSSIKREESTWQQEFMEKLEWDYLTIEED